MIKINLILFFCLTVSFLETKAQTIYFNEHFNNYDRNDFASAILSNDSTYFIVSTSLDSGNLYRLHFMLLDSIGGIINEASFGKPGWYYADGYVDCAIRINDGYVVTGGVYNSANQYLVLLAKVNELMDTLWTKTYGDSVTFYAGHQVRQTIDGGFIIVGATNNGSTQALLIKTDSLGNKQWEQNYGGTGTEYGLTIHTTLDGGYIIGGTTTSIGNGNVDSWIFKTDSLGNFQWERTFGGIYGDCPASVGVADSSGYVFCGCEMINNSDYSKIRIAKLDLNGNTIWDSLYLNQAWGTNLYNIVKDSDENLIAVGTTGAGFTNLSGLVLKTDGNGNLLWKRNLVHLSGSSANNLLYDLDLNSQDEIVACGFTGAFGTDPQDIWVIKLDEWGCDTAGCQSIGIDKIGVDPYFNVYPNPASGNFKIDIAFSEEITESELTIMDLSGRIVYKHVLSASQETLEINTENIQPGIYFITLVKNNRILKTKKLVVAE